MTEAQPEISSGRSFSSIWIIPLVAVVLGLWMVIHSFMTEGPEIEVRFINGEGLVAGKTKVKLRNVELGVVEHVRLGEDLTHIIASIKLERDAIPMLREDTEFWVVRARIGAGSISGLGTLLSGAYIELSPGNGATGKREFVGLEIPPLTPQDAPGVRINLYSQQASSVSTGDAVLFRGYKVGRIESAALNPENQRMEFGAFIDAPFDKLVTDGVRFWNISGISVSAGAEGLKVSTGSLDTIVLGGVGFEVPKGRETGEAVANQTEFQLFDSYEEAAKNPYRYGKHYVTSFAQSVGGLRPGAPVTYRGMEIGRVERLMVKDLIQQGIAQELEGTGAAIPVLIYLEPARIALPDEPKSIEWLDFSINTGVPNGMRATLNTGNLITGAQYIDIDYYPDQEPAEVGELFGYTSIPSIPAGLSRLEQKAGALLDKLNDLPLEQTVEGANDALKELDGALASLNEVLDTTDPEALPADLHNTLQQLRAALAGLSPDSSLYRKLNASLGELNRTLSNLEVLTRTLSDQPNAIVMPVELPADPTPEAP